MVKVISIEDARAKDPNTVAYLELLVKRDRKGLDEVTSSDEADVILARLKESRKSRKLPTVEPT